MAGGLILHPLRRRRQKRREELARKAGYAGGMFAGLLAVHWAKKLLNKIPGINVVAAPILDFIPTVLVGPALGAAVVYGVEQGDMRAPSRKAKEVSRRVSNELNEAVNEFRTDILELRRKQAQQAKRLLPELEDQVASIERQFVDMERQLTPALERYYNRTRNQVAQLQRELEDSSGGGRPKFRAGDG